MSYSKNRSQGQEKPRAPDTIIPAAPGLKATTIVVDHVHGALVAERWIVAWRIDEAGVTPIICDPFPSGDVAIFVEQPDGTFMDCYGDCFASVDEAVRELQRRHGQARRAA